MIEVRRYEDRQGRVPYDRWFFALNINVQGRIATAIDRLERGGATAKGVGGGVMELRLFFGPGYRIYFGKDGDTLIILLGGGTKQRQHLDIEAAKLLWREYNQGKQEP